MSHYAQAGERFELELSRDRQLALGFNLGTLAASLLIVVILLVLVIPMGRTSPWLALLSLYAVLTRLGVFLSRRAFRYPLLLLHGEDADPEVVRAARDVFRRHSDAIVREILAEERRRGSKAGALTFEEAAALAREREPVARRRVGAAALAAWLLGSAGIWWAIIATGAGPTT